MLELIALYLTLSIAEQQGINHLACDIGQTDDYQFVEGFHQTSGRVYSDNSKIYFDIDETVIYDTEGKKILAFEYQGEM